MAGSGVKLSFITDWPEIWKSEIPSSGFCAISRDRGELRISALVRMFFNKMLQNAAKRQSYSFYCFWVIKGNITGKGVGGVDWTGKIPPPPPPRYTRTPRSGLIVLLGEGIIPNNYHFPKHIRGLIFPTSIVWLIIFFSTDVFVALLYLQ